MAKVEKLSGKEVELFKDKANLATMSNSDLAALLPKLSSSDDNEITSEYLKIEVGEGVRAFFMEMVEINKLEGEEGEKSPAARFLTSDGKFVINADVVVVSTCSRLEKLTPVEIICTGKTGAKNREYKTFKIIKLEA